MQDYLASLQCCDKPVRVAIEGLLSHFFYPYLMNYHQEDVLWFMELANKQLQWRPHPLQNDEDMSAQMLEMSEGVVAGQLVDDLLSKMEKAASTHTETEVLCRGGSTGGGGGGFSSILIFRCGFELDSLRPLCLHCVPLPPTQNWLLPP